ncbi:MAG: GAF domain-containing protein [Syntrophaceae bacterium]|nr:GAF domain-containing protein [Syntrophaceae bacterium]
MEIQTISSKKRLVILIGILVFFGLYLTSLYSYPLFHSLAEMFSIVIACGIFMIAWNSRRFIDNHYLLFLGVAYLFIAAIDLIHTLSFKGMGVFQGHETNLPTQLWIAARYMESISLLIAPFFIRRKVNLNLVFSVYTMAAFLLFASVFYWEVFPVCFIEGVGLTPFKKVSEYIISLILLGSIVLLLNNRKEFDRTVLQWVLWSIILTIASELSFTFYIDAYGFSNLVGHYFKVISFYLIYKALIETGMTRPYSLLLRNLKQREDALAQLASFPELNPNPVVEVDLTGYVSYFNSAATQLFPDLKMTGIQHPWLAGLESLPEIFERLKKESYIRELKIGDVWYEQTIHCVSEGKRLRIFGLDITERKWAEEALQKAYDELEQRVKERTSQLMRANEQLIREMEEHKQAEEEKVRQHRRLEGLWKITRNIDADYKTLYDLVLVEIIEMTQSRYGFYGFINEDESVMTIHSWSKEAMEICKMNDKPIEFPIAKSGLWGEAVRKRKILIVNDYKGDHPGKKGTPEGHVSLTRILTVPVFSQGRIIALAAISNKPTDYTEEDAEQIDAFVTHLQVILERRQAREALQESERRLRLLSSQLLTVQEAERKRVARELHDGIGQTLTAIKFKIEDTLQEKGRGKSGAEKTSLEALNQMVKKSIEEVRKIQMDLRPSTLDDLGVLATISWFTREFGKIYSSLHIEKQINLQEDEVPDPLKTTIFRLIQESLNNTAKHSKADLAHLSLQTTDNGIELRIEDNGMGFDLENAFSLKSAGRGYGLSSMRERVELSGGSFAVESTKGKGTLVRASWPLQQK